jgi:DNA-binding transcriptional LysR family regulator
VAVAAPELAHLVSPGARPVAFVRLRSFEAICQMVEAGVGIGIVPEPAARRCARGMPSN